MMFHESVIVNLVNLHRKLPARFPPPFGDSSPHIAGILWRSLHTEDGAEHVARIIRHRVHKVRRITRRFELKMRSFAPSTAPPGGRYPRNPGRAGCIGPSNPDRHGVAYRSCHRRRYCRSVRRLSRRPRTLPYVAPRSAPPHARERISQSFKSPPFSRLSMHSDSVNLILMYAQPSPVTTRKTSRFPTINR